MFDHDDLVRGLAAACRQRDFVALRALLDGDAVAVCDSAGLLPPATQAIYGPAAIAQLLAALCWQQDAELTIEAVNGRTGLALRRTGRAVAVIDVLAVTKVSLLLIVLNPAKLRAWHRS